MFINNVVCTFSGQQIARTNLGGQELSDENKQITNWNGWIELKTINDCFYDTHIERSICDNIFCEYIIAI